MFMVIIKTNIQQPRNNKIPRGIQNREACLISFDMFDADTCFHYFKCPF